jgi:hypothetical protein
MKLGALRFHQHAILLRVSQKSTVDLNIYKLNLIKKIIEQYSKSDN